MRFRKLFFVLFLVPGLVRPVLAAETDDDATRQLSSQTDVLRQTPPDITQQKEKTEVLTAGETAQSEEDGPEGPKFFIRKIVIEGNTVFPQKDLEEIVKPYENRTLVFSDLEKLASLLTAHYRGRGYATSMCYIPPQKITDETVTLEIVQARIGKLSVQENRWFSERVYLEEAGLKTGDVFSLPELEMALSEVNRRPDRAVKAFIEKGDEPGVSDIVLKAEDQNPVHFSYEFNRRGSELTHWSRNVLHATHNNLTGHGDSLQGSASMATDDALRSGDIRYEFPIPETGTTLHFNAGAAESRLLPPFRASDVRGNSFAVEPGVTQNFVREPSFTLDGYLGFEVKDSKISVPARTISFDRMRVLRVGPRLGFSDKTGRTLLNADVHVGIPEILGGSEEDDASASRASSGGDFTYITANWVRLQSLPHKSFLIFQAGGQWSGEPLTSVEQYRLGGMYSVRGYPESDSAGDSGFNGSVELRVPPYFIPRTWTVPDTKKTWRETLSWVTFVEGGRTFNHLRDTIGSVKDKSLFGAGFGVRFYLSPDMNVQADVGFPFGDDSSQNNAPQAHAIVRIGF